MNCRTNQTQFTSTFSEDLPFVTNSFCTDPDYIFNETFSIIETTRKFKSIERLQECYTPSFRISCPIVTINLPHQVVVTSHFYPNSMYLIIVNKRRSKLARSDTLVDSNIFIIKLTHYSDKPNNVISVLRTT